VQGSPTKLLVEVQCARRSARICVTGQTEGFPISAWFSAVLGRTCVCESTVRSKTTGLTIRGGRLIVKPLIGKQRWFSTWEIELFWLIVNIPIGPVHDAIIHVYTIDKNTNRIIVIGKCAGACRCSCSLERSRLNINYYIIAISKNMWRRRRLFIGNVDE
jgi:hypothetical protein